MSPKLFEGFPGNGAGKGEGFSFRLGGAALNRFSQAAERYLQAHAERRFSTLDYWKNIRKPFEMMNTE